MNSFTQQKLFIHGPAGKLETILAEPADQPRGIAIIAHPHPLYGGTMNNKVVYTLFKSFLELGFIAVRFNFRGVEQSEGALTAGKDDGAGETEDAIAVAESIKDRFKARFDHPLPLWLGGFSFGGGVQAHAARALKPEGIVMVAPAVERVHAPPLVFPEQEKVRHAPRILIVHGDQDNVVALETVLNWAAPQELPVVVVPGAEHFFHGRLHILKRIISDTLRS